MRYLAMVGLLLAAGRDGIDELAEANKYDDALKACSEAEKAAVRARDVAAVQALLPKCVIDEKRCAEGLDRLALYHRQKDERLGTLRQNPVHDWTSHGADAFRTFAMGRRAFRRGTGDPNSQASAVM